MFHGCISLTNVDIPNSVTTIGSSAFFYCTSLTNVTIPSKVDSIRSSAFNGCTGLTNIYCRIKKPQKVLMGDYLVFNNVPKETCTLHVPKGTKDLYMNADQWKDFLNIIDDLDGPMEPGDVNGDGRVNVSDVSALINMILGIVETDEQLADINGDGKVNVSDVTALINIILGVE